MLNLFWSLSMRRDSQLACETDCLKSYNWAVIRQSSLRAELSMKYSDKYERTPLFYKAYHQPNKIQIGRWKFAGHFCNIFHSFIFPIVMSCPQLSILFFAFHDGVKKSKLNFKGFNIMRCLFSQSKQSHLAKSLPCQWIFLKQFLLNQGTLLFKTFPQLQKHRGNQWIREYLPGVTDVSVWLRRNINPISWNCHFSR